MYREGSRSNKMVLMVVKALLQNLKFGLGLRFGLHQIIFNNICRFFARFRVALVVAGSTSLPAVTSKPT